MLEPPVRIRGHRGLDRVHRREAADRQRERVRERVRERSLDRRVMGGLVVRAVRFDRLVRRSLRVTVLGVRAADLKFGVEGVIFVI